MWLVWLVTGGWGWCEVVLEGVVVSRVGCVCSSG